MSELLLFLAPFSLSLSLSLSLSIYLSFSVELGTKVSKLLPKIGNIVADDVPVSNDEDKDNKVVSTFGPNPTGDQYMHHHEVLTTFVWTK